MEFSPVLTPSLWSGDHLIVKMSVLDSLGTLSQKPLAKPLPPASTELSFSGKASIFPGASPVQPAGTPKGADLALMHEQPRNVGN